MDPLTELVSLPPERRAVVFRAAASLLAANGCPGAVFHGGCPFEDKGCVGTRRKTPEAVRCWLMYLRDVGRPVPESEWCLHCGTGPCAVCGRDG